MSQYLKRFVFVPFIALSLMVAVVAMALPGCGASDADSGNASKYQPADDNKTGDAQKPAVTDQAKNNKGNVGGQTGLPPSKPPVRPSEALGPEFEQRSYDIPMGAPEEILAHIQKLDALEPRGRTDKEAWADYAKIQQAQIEGCDRILKVKAEEEVRLSAVHIKVKALRNLASMKTPNSEDQMFAFCKWMVTDQNEDVARMGKLMSFGYKIGDFVEDRTKDFSIAKNELVALLKDEKTHPDLVEIGQQVASQLYGSEHKAEAGEIMKLIGTALKDNKDLAEVARNLVDQSKMIELDFESKMQAVLDNKPNAGTELVAVLKQFAGTGEPSSTVFEAASHSANLLEYSGDYTNSAELYKLITSSFEKHSNKELAEAAVKRSQNGLKRAALIGKPFQVSGVSLDGKPLDWSAYAGKVVLVDFWATWCGPCKAEIPNIEKNYAAFHEKGFEVVSVNLDDEREEVEKFVATKKFPWANVVSEDPEKSGFDNPLAVHCGIDAIPFIVLVNRDGVAVALHVRGEKLEQKLTEMLGPPEVSGENAPKKGAANTAEKENPLRKMGSLDKRSRNRNITSRSKYHFVSFGVDEAASGDEPASDSKSVVNPYAAPKDLSTTKLIDFILDMEEKPRSIQKRDGFAEAVVDAADRILAAETKASFRRIAALAKFNVLHKKASMGDDQADKQLAKLVEQVKDSTDKRVVKMVALLKLEQKVLEADDLPLDKIPELLAELKEHFSNEKLTEHHLRMASSTVRLINQLDAEDEKEKEKLGDVREKHFAEFGNLFAKSDNKELASYGKKLAKPPAGKPSDLVGKPLELAGVTALGAEFDWKSYRGKVVLVDFWATWCGPCRRAMPHVKALYEKENKNGFEVVGVSLDKDLDALSKYVEENSIPWENLAGDETQTLAKKYSVRGIPTMMLVDREGKIVAVSHNVKALESELKKLLSVKNS